MSYDHAPRWTQNIILPRKYDIRCPGCGLTAFNAEEIMDVLKGNTYYVARHFPPALIATCDNIECDLCDEDFAVELKVVVSIVDMPQVAPRIHWIIEGIHSRAMIVCQGLESVFRAAMHFGFPLDDYDEVRLATAEEISDYKHRGCQPLIYGG